MFEQNWMIVMALVAIILCGIGYYVFSSKSKRQEGLENATPKADKRAEILFFFAEWCPHCQSAKPEWEKFKSEYESTTVNGWKLHMKEIDCSDPDAQTEKIIDDYDVEGFPTILMVKDGEVIQFDSDVKYDTLKQFVTSTL